MNTDKSRLASLLSLEGKTAVITGATSGIGKGVADLFLAAGAQVVLSGGTASKLDAIMEAMRKSFPNSRFEGRAADVSKEQDVLGLFELADQAFGGVDVLVECAGIYPAVPFLDSTVELWDKVMSINARGAYLCNREAVRRMKAKGQGGSIVNVSSVASVQSLVQGHAHYSASKAAVNMLTRSLALDFGVDNIRVNAVLPGSIDTEGLRSEQADHAAAGRVLMGPVMQADRLPMLRIGSVSDIANTCLFLAAPASSYITGQLIIVDGGFDLS